MTLCCAFNLSAKIAMSTTPSPAVTGKPRPPLFRALGRSEPPTVIEVDGFRYQRLDVFKHDSWAATACYQRQDGNCIVCKFNRQQSILGFPMQWLGRMLARREAWFLRTLADLPGIPRPCGPVVSEGQVLTHAVAHDFVAGNPLRKDDHIEAPFFDQLEALLAEVHRRGIAYMDLHKRENIIRGDDGRGYLIDFQVSLYVSPRSWLLPLRWAMASFQEGDRYNLLKNRLSYLPTPDADAIVQAHRPWWIRAHRVVAVPLRELRRWLLVKLGIRKGNGRAQSEHFTEDGLREAGVDGVSATRPVTASRRAA
jgi:hypothetical protein